MTWLREPFCLTRGRYITLAILVAVQSEEVAVRSVLSSQKRFTIGGFPVVTGYFRGKKIIICRSGMGRRATSAAESLLAENKPDALFYLGFSGALLEDQDIGNG